MEQETKNRIRVLVVDDEELVADTLVDRLSKWGYEATAAYNGHEGLKLFKEGDFQLVLLDLKMPDMDGITVFKLMRALDQRVPVIMISGYGSTKTAGEAMRLGFYDFVAKPADVKALEMTIKQALKARAEG